MAHKQKTRRPMAEINVVPYIDVMLVLLIIFMITAPLLTQGVKVDLPQAEANMLEEDAKRPLVVSIDRQGGYHLTYDDDKTVAVDPEQLLLKTTAILTHNRNIPVLVKGDTAVDYGRVVDAMVLLQQAGAPSIGLITEPPEN